MFRKLQQEIIIHKVPRVASLIDQLFSEDKGEHDICNSRDILECIHMFLQRAIYRTVCRFWRRILDNSIPIMIYMHKMPKDIIPPSKWQIICNIGDYSINGGVVSQKNDECYGDKSEKTHQITCITLDLYHCRGEPIIDPIYVIKPHYMRNLQRVFMSGCFSSGSKYDFEYLPSKMLKTLCLSIRSIAGNDDIYPHTIIKNVELVYLHFESSVMADYQTKREVFEISNVKCAIIVSFNGQQLFLKNIEHCLIFHNSRALSIDGVKNLRLCTYMNGDVFDLLQKIKNDKYSTFSRYANELLNACTF